jgi:hypothetical protein
LTSVVASGHSTVMTVLTNASVAATYNSSTSSDFDGISGGRYFKYFLSSMKATAALSSH